MNFKFVKIFYYIVTGAIIISFFFYLLKNQNHFPLPNTDLFQYINDGQQYLKLKFPDSIHPPPIAPLLICFIAKFAANVEYPELFSAHIINIVCATLILLNIFLILKKRSLFLATATVFLLASNKIFIYTSLNTTNEIIYGFLLTLTLLIYQKKFYKVAYLLSGLIFLVRYESIVLPISIFIIQFFFNKKQFKLKNMVIAFFPIIIWLFILNNHSAGGTSLLQNAYILEMKNGIKNIPNLKTFESLFDTIVFNPSLMFVYDLIGPHRFNLNIANNINIIFPIILGLLSLFSAFKPKQSILIRIISLAFVLNVLFLALFPIFCIRYLTPVIWIIYLLIINRKNKQIKILLVSLLVIFNVKNFKEYTVYDQVNEKSEYRLVADWINDQTFQKPTYVLIYDPPILQYFSHNQNVYIDYNVFKKNPNIFTECKDQIKCVIESVYNDKINSRFLVISTSTSTKDSGQAGDEYNENNLHHMNAFNDKFFSRNPAYTLIETLGNSDNWVRIYEYH